MVSKVSHRTLSVMPGSYSSGRRFWGSLSNCLNVHTSKESYQNIGNQRKEATEDRASISTSEELVGPFFGYSQQVRSGQLKRDEIE